ncbi:Uncharacterised protein [Serratia fonticola]|nr:Uncharacterised protein [Serratia fonticola]CAI1709230.1 Uncharacterised protein [Serratia fonticola]CAI1749450.1 Uncharacterised protein [Serratia fonticola]
MQGRDTGLSVKQSGLPSPPTLSRRARELQRCCVWRGGILTRSEQGALIQYRNWVQELIRGTVGPLSLWAEELIRCCI